MKSKSVYWLRWIAVLPAAVIGYFLGYAVMKLTSLLRIWFEADREGNFFETYGVPVIAGGVAGYALVMAGTLISPAHNKIVALILLLISTCAVGIGIFLLSARLFSWPHLLEIIGQITGSVIAYFIYLKQSEEFD